MELQRFGISQGKNNMVSASIKLTSMKLTFAQWLKLRRDMAGLRQIDIADVVGVTVQAVSTWEKGTSKPSLNPYQTQQLCLVLNVTFDELVKGFNGEAEISIN